MRKLTVPEFLEQYPIVGASLGENAQMSSTQVQTLQEENLPGMVYAHHSMQRLAQLVRKVARTDVSVLIMGETGTGKELIARAIHALSPRKSKPYRVVDCTTLTPEIAPNELFGHIAGAFTSASKNQVGILAEANNGTVFLDEISTLPLAIQAQFLRVLESREVRQVGAGNYTPLDIRVISASNEPVKELMKEGRFREDLFHRLNVFPLVLPPLRDRGDDIPLLVQHFLQKTNGSGVTAEITLDAMERLRSYPWPGNVRELYHVLARARILRETETAPITCAELPSEIFDDGHQE